MEKEKLSFYDVKTKKKFITDDYRVVKKTAKGRDRYFAVAKSLAGEHECWRVLSKVQAEELK
jgi:hypothetical protein